MRRLIFLLLLVWFVPIVAIAAPSVSGVSGTVTDGQSITITGSGFGTKSTAAPQLFDMVDIVYNKATPTTPYSGVSNGQSIPVGAGYVYTANESRNESPIEPGVKLSTSGNRGVRTSHYYSGSGGKANLQAPFISPYGFTGKTVYATWWLKFSISPSALGGANKFLRYWDGHDADSDKLRCSWEDINMYCYPNSNNWANWIDYGATNSWNRMEIWNNIENAGTIDAWVFNQTNNRTSSRCYTVTRNTKYNEQDFFQEGLIGFDSNHTWGATTIITEFGELYLDNSPQRVEICNATTFSASTHCEIQIPTAWADGSATVTVNRGTFGVSDVAYLYVLDGSNVSNTNGQQIIFGDIPSSVQGLTIQGGSLR